MNTWRKYNRKAIPAEMRSYVDGEDLTAVSVGDDDRKNGSPKEGDMIARDPSNHGDMWLINASYFAEKFDITPIDEHATHGVVSSGKRAGWPPTR